MDLDHLYRIPVAALLGAGWDAFLLHAVPRSTWKSTRFGRLTPVLWSAVLGTALAVVACTPTLRHVARIVLVDHIWWVDLGLWAGTAVLITAVVLSIRRSERERAERTAQSDQTRRP
ncbi:hypothetical protein [Kitasatospora griseola]|uniref:hypothetical protein n=1 Tax=Kitasatospora griseola TaxID=2064 RepID=UPI00380280C4